MKKKKYSCYVNKALDGVHTMANGIIEDNEEKTSKGITEVYRAGMDKGYVAGMTIGGFSLLTTALMIHINNKHKYKN